MDSTMRYRKILLELVSILHDKDELQREKDIWSIQSFLSEIEFYPDTGSKRPRECDTPEPQSTPPSALSDRPIKRLRILPTAPLSQALRTTPSESSRPSQATPYTADPQPAQWVTKVPIGPQQSCEELMQTVQRFKDSILAERFQERKSNRAVQTQLRDKDAQLLVNFFFTDVFGDGARQRIYALVDEMASSQHEEPSLSPGRLAAQRASDQSLLPEVRAFFSVYSTWYQSEVEVSKVYTVILHSIRSYHLYLGFAQLRAIAVGPKSKQLRSFLAEQGFTQSRGVDIRTCILRYLSHELDIPLGRLNNTLQAQLGIYYIVQVFGPGVLVLLPRIAPYRITRIGLQKVQGVLGLLRTAIPEAVSLCTLAEANILRPLLQGKPFPPLMSNHRSSRTTLSLTEAATSIAPQEVAECSEDTLTLLSRSVPSLESPSQGATKPGALSTGSNHFE